MSPSRQSQNLAECGVSGWRSGGPARHTLALDAAQRVQRRLTAEICPTAAPLTRGPDHSDRTICDVEHRQELPGRRICGEGEAGVTDASVNHAYDGLGATFDFSLQTLSRSSIDGAGLPLDASVHYRQDYDNAFWDGEQMVFGDGDDRAGRIWYDVLTSGTLASNADFTSFARLTADATDAYGP
ncbi:hypothetical protein ACF08M_37355 [Streptomyces sp. NPDC015032]|uniref:hypothetical protein n=1 Tax=Streptomyces sp. NPDC015032 TaxID=3364937 RepID=UPI0036FFE782